MSIELDTHLHGKVYWQETILAVAAASVDQHCYSACEFFKFYSIFFPCSTFCKICSPIMILM